jgi:hypothetical protein
MMLLRSGTRDRASFVCATDWYAGSAVLIAALSFVIFGSKLLFISHYGSPVPYWDQWDAEAAGLYAPYLDGNLPLSSLFASHNEHRIFFTRIVALGLLNLAGQWDPVLQMVVNAMIHTAAIALLTALLFRVIPEKDHRTLALLTAITFSLPVGWENLLAGFQSQFYFLLLFSFGCFALMTRSKAFSAGWFFGVFLAAAAYFSLSSGTFAFFAAAAVVALQIRSGERTGRLEWLSVAVLIAAGCLCLMFVRTVAGHAPLKAHGVGEFLEAFISLAGFPFSAPFKNSIGMKLFLLPLAIGPATVLLILTLEDSPRVGGTWLLTAIFLFIMLQIASISYGRAQGFFASRYLDLLLVLVPVGFAILSRLGTGRLARSGWLFGAMISLIYFAITSSAPQITERGTQSEKQLQNVKAFLATSDVATLQNKPFLEIPYPFAERLAMLLSMPQVRSVLATEIRPSDDQTLQYRYSHMTHSRLYDLIAGLKSFVLSIGPLIFALGVTILIFRRPGRDDLVADSPARSA